MSNKIVTATTGEPVDLITVKAHLKVETTVDDHLIEGYIKAARAYAENYTGRQMMPATREQKINWFYSSAIELEHPPLATTEATAVTITYIDYAGNSTTLSTAYYWIDGGGDNLPGRVVLKHDQCWPETQEQVNAITIQYPCGYALSSNSTITVPEPIKVWIMVRVAQMYEHRGPILTGRDVPIAEMPADFVDGLLDPYTLIEIV